ncbi:MAG: hypothetical protein AB7P69_24100 [Candidatus Binatia bacterium]
MLSMKKGLAALVAACFLFIGGGQAQAVVGIPDDVPANTLLYPFFKVNPSRTASQAQDTLLVATNTDNTFSSVWVHFVVWSVTSQHVYDFNVKLTANDVFSCSLYDLILGPGCANESQDILPAPSSVAVRLTVDGQLRGYVTADVVTAPTSLLPTQSSYPRATYNILIGHEYIVDLPAGSATGINAVSIEYVGPSFGHPAVGFGQVDLGGANDTRTGFFSTVESDGFTDGLERIDGREGDLAQTGTADTTAWWEIIRYFTVSVPGLEVDTELWLWKDANHPGLFVNLAVYDEEENVHSVSIDLPFEVNFRDVRDLITPGAPGGWFRIPFAAEPEPIDDDLDAADDNNIQSVAYSLQLGNDASAVLRWDAIFPAHRQYTDYLLIN